MEEEDTLKGRSRGKPCDPRAAEDQHLSRVMEHVDQLLGDEGDEADRDAEGRGTDTVGGVDRQDATAAVDEGEGPEYPEAAQPLPEYIVRRQEALLAAPTVDVVEVVTHYLRATSNVKLVSAEEEHAMFPVVMQRLHEFHVSELLDMVEAHWARSTLVRYGIAFKDAVRDRIADIANEAARTSRRNAAATQGSVGVDDDQHPLQTPVSAARHGPGASLNDYQEDGEGVDSIDDGGDDAVYAHEVEAQAALRAQDPVLAAASCELSAPVILRCIVVMGMSAGRRKRDLDFFSALGHFFAHNINEYKDPNDLVRVLTAFARAKIVPSKSFLALLARRFPVVSKRAPLEPLPCYRAMVNFGRMGHESMSTYRFFADYMLAHMERKIAEEVVLVKRQRADVAVARAAVGSVPTGTESYIDQLSDAARAEEQVARLTGLTPRMLTRWLLVLARHGAPHQAYLRPLIKPVVVPLLPHLPPPSLTRLLLAVRMFKTTDLEIVEPIIDVLCDAGPSGANFLDVLTMLSVLSGPDAAVPVNMDRFLRLCEAVCAGGAAVTAEPSQPPPPLRDAQRSSSSSSGGGVDSAAVEDEDGVPRFVLRPADMCTVANYLLRLQRRPEIPLESLTPLTSLMECFARRLTYLMELRVVSLTHVDVFADICAQQQHPDVSGSIARMQAARRAVSATLDGEDAYYLALDIDVRDTFFKILVVNSTNTYGEYRPLPGPMQLDFREWLTTVSALDLLAAVDLHERACPRALGAAPSRFLARALLQKFGMTGEEVVNTEAHRLELRPPEELLLTRDDLVRLAALVARTPLRPVRESAVVWSYLLGKAERLGVSVVAVQANAALSATAGGQR